MLLSRLHYPVTNLGYGVRAGIWFQGCTVYCKGCVSRDTWAFDETQRCDLDAVLTWLNQIGDPIDGITISGGEPTDQPEALRALLDGVADRRDKTDILMYSGRSTEQLAEDLPWLWDRLDVLISEPFEAARTGACALRGSSNQRVHRLSPLAELRYPEDGFEELYQAQRQKISVNVDARTVWMVGIPRVGDLARLHRSLEARGISMEATSWLS